MEGGRWKKERGRRIKGRKAMGFRRNKEQGTRNEE
jgi:hypothetical protein